MKREVSRQIFEKHWNTRFNENLSSGSRVVPYGPTYGRTDRHDKAHSRFSQLCENASKNVWTTQKVCSYLTENAKHRFF